MFRRLMAAAALCIAVCGPGLAFAQEKTTLRLGVIANSSKSISQLGLWVAQQKGFLDREGIDLTIVPLRGVQYQIEELDKGNVDVSHTATPYLVQAALHGSDSVAILGGLANPVFAVLAKPGIKSLADLKGKTIGLSLPVDTITIGTMRLLEKAGVHKGDFTTKEIVGTPPRVACLVDGACDAVPVGQPDDLVLAQKGFVNLGNSLQVIPELQFNVIAARKAWAAAHRDVMVRFVRAFGNAYRFMADPAHRDEVTRIAAEKTGASVDVTAKIMKLYYDPWTGIMPKSGEINAAGMTAVVSLMAEAGELKAPLPDAAQFSDLTYLRAAGMQP